MSSPYRSPNVAAFFSSSSAVSWVMFFRAIPSARSAGGYSRCISRDSSAFIPVRFWRTRSRLIVSRASSAAALPESAATS